LFAEIASQELAKSLIASVRDSVKKHKDKAYKPLQGAKLRGQIILSAIYFSFAVLSAVLNMGCI